MTAASWPEPASMRACVYTLVNATMCGLLRLRGILESLLYLRLTPFPRQHPRTRVANICQLLQRHICYHEEAVRVILPTTVCKVAAIHSSEAGEFPKDSTILIFKA